MTALASVKIPAERKDALHVLLVLGSRLKECAIGVLGGHRVESVPERSSLAETVKKNHYDLALLEGDLDTLSSIKAADPRVEVIYFGDCGADEIEVINRGGTYCLPTVAAAERIRECVESISELAESRRSTVALEKLLAEKYTFAGVVGKNPRMIERLCNLFDNRRDRGRQGRGCKGAPLRKPQFQRAVHRLQLRGAAGEPPGVRVLRLQ